MVRANIENIDINSIQNVEIVEVYMPSGVGVGPNI